MALGLALANAPAGHAQMAHRVKARIPFEFTVSNKVLPDGAYVVGPSALGSVKIQSLDGRYVVLELAMHARSAAQKEATLVFDRIDEHYFLRQIWEPESDAG